MGDRGPSCLEGWGAGSPYSIMLIGHENSTRTTPNFLDHPMTNAILQVGMRLYYSSLRVSSKGGAKGKLPPKGPNPTPPQTGGG